MNLVDTKVGFWNAPAYWRQGYFQETTSILQRPYLIQDYREATLPLQPKIIVSNQLHSRAELSYLRSIIHSYDNIIGSSIYIDHRASDFAFLLQEAQDVGKIKAYQLRLQDADAFDHKFEEALWYIKEQQKVIEIWSPVDLIPIVESKIRDYEGTIVLDQMGNPDMRNGRMLKWQNALKALSKHPNIYIKLSGLMTLAHWQYWQLDDIIPYFRYAVSEFGPGRIIFGSDWPYISLAGSFQDLQTLLQRLQSHTSIEPDSFFYGNAMNVYDL